MLVASKRESVLKVSLPWVSKALSEEEFTDDSEFAASPV
jgi:hypothetical protein